MALTSMSKSSELIYTSATQGLRPGSRGFCTVVMSENMPAGLVGPLESLSAYRHTGGDGTAPVNYMHVQMKVAGRPVNVLSRIAEAPPDYTGRTNKIAHHVVVATTDRAAGGPAAVLRQPGFAVEVWDGEVRKIPEPKTVPPADSPLRIAETWARQCGDAGWAGAVASIFDNRTPGPPTYLIYRAEQNAELLALVDEAICLLPESKRWNATFATYTSELPPGVHCQLRCLIAGSPEALTLPPSALTLDIASGNLGTPPPGPMVSSLMEAARSGRLDVPEPVGPAGLPDASLAGQVAIPELANQSAASDANEFDFPVLPPQPMPGQLPPPVQPKSSPVRKYARMLISVTTLLLLCLGGATAWYLAQTDSDSFLAELNAEAGIDNPPEVDVSPKAQPVPNVEQEPEPEMKPNAADAEAEAKEVARQKAETEKLKSLEGLAKRILDGEVFLNDNHKNSITKFSDTVKNELKLLAEQKKLLAQQKKLLGEIPARPTDEQWASWVRAEDGRKQLTSFIDTRKKDIDELKPHSMEDLRAHWERLAEDLKAWDIEAKKWEDEQENQSELILLVPNRLTVEQTIKKVRATARAHLKNSMSSLEDRYEELSIGKTELAASIEEKFDPLQTGLVAELKRRRDSHRLKIYFDGDSSRKEDRLQFKPRCVIVLKPDDLKAINRLRADDSKLIPLTQSNVEVKLPGRFDGWLTVMLVDFGIILKFDLNQKNIPQSVRQKNPILQQLSQQLDQFVEQQDATFQSSQSLQTTFEANTGKVDSGINQWLEENKGKKNEDKEKRKDEAAKWRDAIQKMKEVVNQPPASKLNELYIKQTAQTVKDLQSLKLNIAEVFEKFVTPDVAIRGKIDEHIKNLESLRDKYNELMKNNGLLDFEGQLVFGKESESSSEQSSTNFGQSLFKPIETFELFFIPELAYGPPPND